ncbi:hypothetical protein DXG01_008475 [Tephrocybe rancida]|nr:hypothetical protein DXG01_008475 [Tephrocybe rancida]
MVRARLQHHAGLRKTPNSSAAAAYAKIGSILGDSRTLWRIWGLLPIVQWLISIERTPHRTRNLLTIERLQGWSMLAYYPLEHISYLLSHGLIPTTIPNIASLFSSSARPISLDAGRLGIWSTRFWALYVLLQFAHLREDRKLLQARQRNLRKGKGTGLSSVDKRELKQRWNAYWTELVTNLAYLPLTIHWSLEKGIIKNDVWVGALGLIAGVASFRSGWKATALPSPPPVTEDIGAEVDVEGYEVATDQRLATQDRIFSPVLVAINILSQNTSCDAIAASTYKYTEAHTSLPFVGPLTENAMSATNESFDIIFAGGGAAACVTAGRLAQADPQLKILTISDFNNGQILEAGPLTQDMPDHIQPARYFSNLLRPSETLTMHTSKPSAALAGRSVVVPSGRCLGGGSSVNFTMYTRAAASDYDDWESVHGNPGWGSKHLIPLLEKAETFQANGDFPTHGTSGPIKASFSPTENNVGAQFLAVASQYDKERESTNDANAFFKCNAYGTNGRRSDTPHNYIYNHPEYTNLMILERRRVVRVIFENLRAVGVEHVSDLNHQSDGVQEPSISYVAKLVVVSAGAFGSPAILERSGIGGKDVLEKNKITQLVELPGVGEHYMDHNLIFAPYFASQDADTMDVIFRGSDAELEPFVKTWVQDGKGLMAQNALDAGVKLRPNAEDLKELGPAFESRWKSYFENAPDKPVVWLGTFAAYAGNDPAAPRGKYFSATYYTEYPVSTGRVHITGGLNPYGKLDFEPGYLDDPADLGVLRWGYKKGRELFRRMDIYRGEFALGHPEYPRGSKAGTSESAQPVAIDSPDISYSAEDDHAIDEYHRKFVATSWHSIGTCAMKQRREGGVVDSKLNVYGVQNLKVADVSITPSNVAANTYNTALAIGEKAAVIIAQDLGILGVTET